MPTNTPGPTNTPAGGGGGPTATPTPIVQGTVRARAVAITSADTSCAVINASNNFLGGTQFTITGQSQQTQNGGSYVQWANVNASSYVLSPIFPGNYGLARGCWTRSVTPPTLGESMGASFTASGEVLTWNVGAVPPGAWVQTIGGDIYTATTLRSLIPSTAVQGRVFSLPGTGGYPGVVRYGSSYDFEIDAGNGGAYISATNWNANTTDRYAVNYYELFWRKFGGPVVPDFDADNLISPIAQPASREVPYYAIDNVVTQGNWNVPSGEKLVMIIDGDLTINGRINTSGTGFAAFIVRGNITVDPSVGTTYSSTTPVLQGVYVTSPAGTFSTGTSTVAGAERFVGQGVFVAGSFILQRDLEIVGQNGNYAAEYFIYDPTILFRLPNEMMDASVTWSEVAP